jgi:hypothetical protein
MSLQRYFRPSLRQKPVGPKLKVRVSLRLYDLRPTTRISIFEMNTCGYSPYVTSSITRGLVCRLQLLLVFASAVIFRSESRGTHDHILLSQIRESLTWRARSPYLYPPVTGWPSYTLRHWAPFSSPPTTRRATVEVFDPASTRSLLCSSKVMKSWLHCSEVGAPHRSPIGYLWCCNPVLGIQSCLMLLTPRVYSHFYGALVNQYVKRDI